MNTFLVVKIIEPFTQMKIYFLIALFTSALIRTFFDELNRQGTITINGNPYKFCVVLIFYYVKKKFLDNIMYNEEFGIIVKLSEYLLKHQIKHIYLQKYKSFEIMLQFHCQNLIFSKYGTKINIKNHAKSGIIINYLDNIKRIHAKDVYLIPWSNIENPLIMYKYNKKYIVKKKKIKRKLQSYPYEMYNSKYILPVEQQVSEISLQVDKPIVNGHIKNLIKSLSNKIEQLNKLL